MKKLIATLLVLFVVFALFAQGASEKEGAQKERKLVIYSALNEDETKLVTDLFEKKTGIKTSAIILGGGEILSRIRAEKDNPVASIYWGGSCDAFIQAANEGLLLQYKSPQLADINFYDKDNYWVCIYSGYVSFVSNNEHERVNGFNRSLGFYAHGKSAKPLGKYIRRAMEHMGSDPSSTALIGDQLLTDIGAGKAGNQRVSVAYNVSQNIQA